MARKRWRLNYLSSYPKSSHVRNAAVPLNDPRKILERPLPSRNPVVANQGYGISLKLCKASGDFHTNDGFFLGEVNEDASEIE